MKLVTLLGLLMTAGNLWGQSTGLYYIANNHDGSGGFPTYSSSTPATNFYLVPASNGGDASVALNRWAWGSGTNQSNPSAATPFVTTYQTNRDNNSVWIIKSSGTDYYLIHVLTGKYMTRNDGVGNNNLHNRRAFHMEVPSSLGNDHLFTFDSHNNSGYYSIKSKPLSSGHRFVNPSKANKPVYYGDAQPEGGYYVAGLIGVFEKNAVQDKGSRWYLEPAPLFAAPTITFNTSTNTVTVTDNNGLPSGYNILYTISYDLSSPPTNPSESSQIMQGGTLQVTMPCIMKAVVERYGVLLTEVAVSEELFPSVTPPTISFSDSYQQINITHPSDDATLYYTTDGTEPTTSNYTGTGQSPLSFTPSNPCTIKAIAVKFWGSSEVIEFNLEKVATPTFTIDANLEQVSIVAAEGATVYYTTEPDAVPNTRYIGPISIPLDQSGQVIVRARALKEGKLPSDVAETLVIYPTLTSPFITYDYDTQKITITHDNTPAENYTIRWTNNESLLISQWTAYTAPVSPITPIGPCTVRAIVVEDDTNYTSDITTLILEQVATPTTALVENQIVISCATEDATIYYTKNGTPPNLESLQYTGPLNVANAGLPIRAIAVKAGLFNSNPSPSVTYHQVATPVIADDGNNHIAITSATADAAIYYTIDGNAPALVYDPATNTYSAGANTLVYTEPLDSSHSSLTIKAIAVKQDMFNSAIGEGVVYLQCPDPVITINAETGQVSITSDLADATICYTTNGTDPNPDPQYQGNSWPTQVYTSPITLYEATTVKALASRTGCYNSNIATRTFEQVEAPVLTFTDQLTITAAEGTTVKYKLFNPSTQWEIYYNNQPLTPSTSGITLGSTRLSVMAVEEGKVPYTINSFVLDRTAAPTIAENGNNAIGITSTTPGATIKFTTDESEAYTSSTAVLYTQPLGRDSYGGAYWQALTSGSVKINAFASKENMFWSTQTFAIDAHLYTLVPHVAINSVGLVEITFAEGQSLPPTDYASFHYTTNGTMPTVNSAIYNGPFTLTAGAIIHAVGVRGTYVSAVSNSITINQVMTPVIMESDNHITISTPELGATIYYTTDGTNPMVTYDSSTGTYTVGENTFLYNPATPLDYTYSGLTIKAVAVKPGMLNSQIVTGSITLRYPEPSIALNPATGVVTLTGLGQSGEVLYYTTDGTTPTTASTAYAAPFSIYNPATAYSATPITVKAIMARQGWNPSDVASQSYYQVITPDVAPTGSNMIEMTSETVGATLFYTTYTTEGSNPVVTYNDGNFAAGTGTNLYSDVLPSTYATTNFMVVAVKAGMIPSPVKDAPAPHTKCKKPLINRYGDQMVISRGSYPPSSVEVTIYYTVTANTTDLPPDPITVNSDGTWTPNSGAQVFTANINLSEYFTSSSNDMEYVNVKAVVVATGYRPSDVSSKKIVESLQTEGSEPNVVYLITQDGDLDMFVHMVNHDGPGYHYKLTANVSAAGIDAIDHDFIGILEGSANNDGVYYTISSLSHPLFNIVNGGTVKNIMFKNVNISQAGRVGTICSEAKGNARIYNCGVLDGTVGSTGSSNGDTSDDCCGGLVGLLDGSARVINCFSYADITGGNRVGGIVGYNNYATTSASDHLKTMVMSCMFYGDILAGANKAPVYGGLKISNKDATGVGNYNYFRAEATYVQNRDIQTYNCALLAETRFLQRFEFFRHLLNGHRELAAWWATGSYDNKDEMLKWVMHPDSIGTTHPYPVLRAPGKYPSVVNYDPATAATNPPTPRNQGGWLGNLTVNIQMGDGAVYNRPTGAGIIEGMSSIILPITDKDTTHFNFNYGKVQLPYYNDVGTKNYTGNRVVTGWKIVSIEGGTPGNFTTGDDAIFDENGIATTMPYNFADRNCTDKDLYSTNGNRIFNQGAYWDVPEGVTAITIEPYWAKAVYLADAYADVVYDSAMTTRKDVPNVGGGQRYNNGSQYVIMPGEQEQGVYTTLGKDNSSGTTAFKTLFSGVSEDVSENHSVYDYAIVLVGNFHLYSSGTGNAISNSTKRPYTVTSIDRDHDNEPDYSFIMRFDGRTKWHPVRFDFLNMPGLGMAQKSTDGPGSYNYGICQPRGWFEATNTALFYVTQFEYSPDDRVKKPIIMHGGVIEQWVSRQGEPGDAVQYFHVGGNVWFKEFHLGGHQDNLNKYQTPHPPVSVNGGDFDEFYLTGLYCAVAPNYDDNAEGYIHGGRFGTVAGAGMEGIGTSNSKGNIVWQIDHADINEFFGGGTNASNPVKGSICNIIKNSHVTLFCGGPKFGDMGNGKKVNTTANDCVFGEFYGAGYGGNSYGTRVPQNYTNIGETCTPNNNMLYDSGTYGSGNVVYGNIDWNRWINGEVSANDGFHGYLQDYSSVSGYTGVSVAIDYQFLPNSNNYQNVARLFVKYVKFSLATTRNVKSTLTNCTVMQDYYGGGRLGKVAGDAESTLNSCTIHGNVFGGGYTGVLPTVEVMNTGGFPKQPYYDSNLGVYLPPDFPETVTYTWDHRNTVNSTATAIDKTNHILYTTEDITTLGTVSGHTTVTVTGDTYVEGLIDGEPVGGVFGGGDEAYVGSSEVHIQTDETGDAHPINNVYGGGNEAITLGNAEVTIHSGLIGQIGDDGKVLLGTGNVFGGGRGRLPMGDETLEDAIDYGRVEGNTTVNIAGGYIRYNVYGGGKLASVGKVNEQYNITSGGATQVNITGGEVGPLDMSGLNAYVYGGGMGVEVDYSNTYKNFADVGSALVAMSGGRVWGSLFGGPADGHVLGNASVSFSGGTLGTTGKTSWDGNIFGGGRNYRHSNYAAGRVGGNITVTMTGGTMLGSVFGGGRLGNTGVDVNGNMQVGDDHGHIVVNISGGTVGNTDIIDHHENYSEEELSYIGHVFGGAKGLLGDLNYGQVKETDVTVSGTLDGTRVLGSVYGGAELGPVRGTESETEKGNTLVTISGGTIGTIGYVSNPDAIVHLNGGKAFGGGKGSTDFIYAGLVYNNATINISGGHVLYSVYGGGEEASVGSSGNLATGLATVNVTGGQVGPAPRVDSEYNIPIGLNGLDGYVFGGGQGIGNDPITMDYPAGQYKDIANVNNTIVTVNMPMENNIPVDTVHNRIWGSIFGGAEDGHVLGNAVVRFMGGLMGTFGTTSYDGNIFGGGRNFQKKNYTAGRVGGNITVEMTGGIMYGSIFGAGRLALTGVDINGSLYEGYDYGLVTVKVKGGTVGNAKKMSTFTTHSMGDVYGGGKGSMEGIAGHPAASALLISIAKNTIVEISEINPNVPTRILGSVYGGGEMANVGDFRWTQQGATISDIYLHSDGLAKVTVSGGTIGVDRMKMRYDLEDGSYKLKYNDDVGHVYGGGEGVVDDPDNYATVNPGTMGHNNVSLLDLMATVGDTEVTIEGDAWVKGSVYGGSANGHVLGDTYVKIAGGQIGAGDNGAADVRYTEEQFFDPTITEVSNATALAECTHWPFVSPYEPFDPVDIKDNNITPSDGKTWFGNVFGGGSGYYPYVKLNTSTGKYETHWDRAMGQVEGDSRVEITGGHILTSVYGGGETNDIGIMDHTTGQYVSNGNATVTMSGGTLGVPRTNAQTQAHPVTCYLFGSGKGDPRIYFNTWTNVNHVDVDITGGIIYGSVFGGGEEGHVIGDVELNVSGNTIIGTIGYSNVDGNIFGGGRGFNAEALTAGTVGGNIDVNITGGTMLGSIYGGGRNGSVGTHLVDVDDPNYGKMQHDVEDNPDTDEDETQTHGHITVNISGGTIGNPYETIEEPIGGNVFGGGMGLATSSIWNQIARAKQTEVNITGNTVVKGSVFGGSKEGSIVMDVFKDANGNEHSDGGNTHVVVSGGTIGWMPEEKVHVGGDIYGGGRGYDSGDEHAADKRLSGIVERNTTVDISGGYILYNIYGGGEMASVGQTTDVTTEGKTYHVPVEGTGIATVNFSGGELGPRPNVDGTDGLNGVDGYLFGGGKGVVHEDLTEQEYLDRYKWFGDVNKTVVTMTGGRIWGSLFGGAEDGHVLDDVYISFTAGTIGTHGMTGYDGNIFSGGRNFSDTHTSTGRVGSNIVTRMTGSNCYMLGSMFGGGRQGSVGVDDYGIMKMDDGNRIYGYTNVAITNGVVGHDRQPGEPLVGGNVYGGSKGKAGKLLQGMVKDATVVITGNAQIKNSVMGGGENAHIMGMTHVTVGDATVDGEGKDGHGVVVGIDGIPGEDGNVYGGGRGDETYEENNNTVYSPTGGIVGTSTNVLINDGRVQGSVYGGGRFASVGNEAALTYYSVDNPFTPADFGRTLVTVTGDAVIGSKVYDNGHVFGGGRGVSHPDFDDFTNVFETFVHIKGNAQVNGSVFGGGENGHVVKYTTENSQLNSLAGERNGDTHVFIDGNAHIGDVTADNNETRGNVYGGGRGLDQYLDSNGDMQWNIQAGRVEGNSHATLLSGTVRRYLFGGSNHSIVHGHKVANIENGIVMRDVYGGSKLLDDSWPHPGLKTVNIHGGKVNNVFGCGFNLNDGDPYLYYFEGNNRYQAYLKNGQWYYMKDNVEYGPVEQSALQYSDAPTSFVNISGGHIAQSVHGAGQAGMVYGSTLVYFGKNAIYNAPAAFNSANTDKNNLYSEKNYLSSLVDTSPTTLTGDAHQVSKLLVEASVYGGSSYFDNVGGSTTNWNNFTTKGYSNIYVDGTGYDMSALTQGWDYATMPTNAMVISGSFYGSGTHCESGEKGRNIIVRNYGSRITSSETGQDGWFIGSTRQMGSIQRVGNLVIDSCNFTFTGMPAIGNDAYEELCAIYKVDSCFYVANGSGIALGQGDVITEMDSIRRIRSLHLVNNGKVVNGVTVNVYNNIFPGKLTWEWIGIRDVSVVANRLFYYSTDGDEHELPYTSENVLVFNTASNDRTSMLHVRYTGRPVDDHNRPILVNGNPMPVKQYYGELQGFFRMKSGLLPWGLKSFAEARPKLTLENEGATTASQEENKGDGGFMSYQSKYNFYKENGNDGGELQTRTNQYPYTNVMEVSSKGNLTDYRIWVVGDFKGHRWYVDGTRGWGRDGQNVANSTTTGWGWGMFADRPKQTIKAIFVEGSYPYGSDTKREFQWYDDEENDKFKDVIYVVGPVDCKLASEYASLNLHHEEPLMLYRYPGGHKLSSSTNHDPDDIDPETEGNVFDKTENPISLSPDTNTGATDENGPGPNYDAMINVGSRTDNQAVVLDNVFVDGLHNHVGLDKTYLSIPETYNMNNVSKPLVVTAAGTQLTLKGGTILQRGFNNHAAATAYYNEAPATAFDGTTPFGGALFVHPNAQVNVEGLLDIRYNWHKLNDNTNIKSNVFLPSFDKYLRITGALSSSAHIGITSPVRNDGADYKVNTFSPVARGVRTGSTTVGEATVDNAVLDAQNAWRDNVFTDDMDGFFGSGTNEQYGSHSTYYKTFIPNYGGSLATENTLFFGWTWSNVVRSQPEGYVEEGSTVTVSSREGLAWLISKVNGLNNETKSSMEGKTILLNTDVEGLDKYVWVPVGSTSMSNNITTEQFAGTFDGQGHLIKGLTVAYIGLGDGRYMFADYGMFGRTNGATINRTFLVDERIEPNSSGNMGGIVGVMQGTGGVISNSEAAVSIEAPTQSSDNGCGGLAGLLIDGTIHSSMAVADITASIGDLGGLVGGALDPKMGSHTDVKVLNSFANVRFNVGYIGNESVEVGGIVGDNELAALNNCYSRLISGGTLPNNHFGTVTASNNKPVVNCYGQEGSYDVNHYNGNGSSEVGCGTYTQVISSDNLGYMYSDNLVTLLNREGEQATLTERLNRGAWTLNKAASRTVADSLYAHWARPGLSEINDDYPVLLLEESGNGTAYQGNFRSVGTYAGGPALQYGGPVRDGSTDEVSAALSRDKDNDDKDDCLFIYGDVTNTISLGDKSITQGKVSIYEHAAILRPGALGASVSKDGEYENTYVGVSFDNSFGQATSTPGINLGWVGEGGFALPRDWHMMSTPLSNAPLGFNYWNQNAPVSGHDSFNDVNHDAEGFYNNPWKDEGLDPSNASNELVHEFDWLNARGSSECTDKSGNYRYWMGDGIDGYFPYKRGELFSQPDNHDLPLESEVENLFITDSPSSSNEYYDDGADKVNRYPYGMDFYSWYEPEYHWVNFKRNGPNHWHSDEDHVHINYTSEVSSNNSNPATNVNETTLISGKGYMAAIAKETLLQSHGTLNAGNQFIHLTQDGANYQGWNLVGNPYHAYLDFDALAAGNSGVIDLQDGTGSPFYLVYNADSYDSNTGLAKSAFRYYPAEGSTGGDYADRYLHPHQGFFVLTKQNANLTFTENMIKSRSQIDHSEFRTGRPAYPLVNMYLSSENGCRDITVIEFNRPEWSGARKMRELRQGNGLFYARYGESDYAALFVKAGANRIPVRFEAMEDDFFTIRWNHANGQFSSMYLVDNMTGVQTDMLTSDEYSFEGHRYDYKSRFYIVFSLVDENADGHDFFTFFDGSQWVVMGEGDLDFIDVLGHVLLHTHLGEGQTRLTLPNVAAGVYLMRLTNGEDCKVQKIIIKP